MLDFAAVDDAWLVNERGARVRDFNDGAVCDFLEKPQEADFVVCIRFTLI